MKAKQRTVKAEQRTVKAEPRTVTGEQRTVKAEPRPMKADSLLQSFELTRNTYIRIKKEKQKALQTIHKPYIQSCIVLILR